MDRTTHPARHNHPASTPTMGHDAPLWDALFPRLTVDERASALASDAMSAHSDADEFTARAVPVGFVPTGAPSRLTAFREPPRRRSA